MFFLQSVQLYSQGIQLYQETKGILSLFEIHLSLQKDGLVALQPTIYYYDTLIRFQIMKLLDVIFNQTDSKMKTNDYKMIYAIPDRYIQSVESFCQCHKIQYQVRKTQTGFSLFSCNAHIQSCKRYHANLLLQEFRTTNKVMVVQDWLEQYNKKIKMQKNGQVSFLLINHILDEDFNRKKQELKAKIQHLRQLMERSKINDKKLSQMRVLTNQKLNENLTNLELRCQMVQLQIMNKKQQNNIVNIELKRVKSIIDNGMWGYLKKIKQKVEKIKEGRIKLNEQNILIKQERINQMNKIFQQNDEQTK